MENSNLQLSNASKGGGVEKLGNCGNNLKDICESVEETDTQLNNEHESSVYHAAKGFK